MCHCTRELADAAKRQEYCHKVIAEQKAEITRLKEQVLRYRDLKRALFNVALED